LPPTRPPRTEHEIRQLTTERGSSSTAISKQRPSADPRARADRTGGVVPPVRMPGGTATTPHQADLPGGIRTLTAEFGVSGLHRVSGFVFEEYLRDLQGYRGARVYREMSDNDAVLGGMLFAFEQLITGATWRVKPADTTRRSALRAQQFVEQCLDDMSHTVRDMFYEILTMLPQGYAWMETTYKVRKGPEEADPAYRSQFQDGLIGWRKIALRGQDTLYRWEFDEQGGIREFWQIAPPDYRLRQIPIEKSLLFRPRTNRNNPEGYSVLRRAYRAWYFCKRIEEIEAIGVERDLAGLPVATPPEGWDILDPDNIAEVNIVKDILRNIRRDEQEGILKPPNWTLELLRSGGTRQMDTTAIIDRYNRLKALSVLAQFLLLGMTNVGSFALSETQQDLFLMAISGWLYAIADVFNRYAIPRLCALNGIAHEDFPTYQAGEVREPKLANLAAFLTATVGSGLITPDPALEAYLRQGAHLPEQDTQGRPETILDSEAGTGRIWTPQRAGIKRPRKRLWNAQYGLHDVLEAISGKKQNPDGDVGPGMGGVDEKGKGNGHR